mgnify:CR=1 FL=1
MNPFEREEETVILQKENDITIWKENRGRKINTYITGWNIDIEDLKSYQKEFKQSKGCNGSIKSDEDTPKLHFQGDKVNEFIIFMISKGVNEDTITLKGQ